MDAGQRPHARLTRRTPMTNASEAFLIQLEGRRFSRTATSQFVLKGHGFSRAGGNGRNNGFGP
jgi:hypothetical protein